MAGGTALQSLQEMCAKVVAANFEERPTLAEVPEAQLSQILNQLSLALPLELAGTLIESEDYWRRRSRARWSNCEPSGHCYSWKQLYFERNLRDTLEEFEAATGDLKALRRLLCFSRRYVHSVQLTQLPSHLDLHILFDCLQSELCSLSITYGCKDVRMTYDRSLFGMKLSDCRSLAKALSRTETLSQLFLSGNLLDDDKVRMLVSGLVDNQTVTILDLSHNRIADRGVRALAKLLDARSVIAMLDLSNNEIHAEGGRALARALRTNESLMKLNLRLNRLGDAGGKYICDVMSVNTTLQKLCLAANALGPEAATSIATALRCNTTLRELDLSCNALGPEGGRELRDVLEQENTTLERVEVRMSHIGEDEEDSIAEVIRQRLINSDRQGRS